MHDVLKIDYRDYQTKAVTNTSSTITLNGEKTNDNDSIACEFWPEISHENKIERQTINKGHYATELLS